MGKFAHTLDCDMEHLWPFLVEDDVGFFAVLQNSVLIFELQFPLTLKFISVE